MKKQRIRRSAHAILFADLIIDKPVFRVYNTRNFIYCSSATCFALKLAENSESGQNPERYRHCMRGGTARDESQSLGFFLRRQCGRLMIRESGDLLECVTCAFCVIMEWTVCLLWKNGHGSVMLPWLFVFTGGLLIAVCGPYLCFSANRQIACPLPVYPSGNRG